VARPSTAELARTAVARARGGTLTTYSRAGAATTLVPVRDDHGALVLGLCPSDLAVADLTLRPLGSIRVAPVHCAIVKLEGTVRRLADDCDGLARFRLEVAAVRIGRVPQPVEVRAYRRAEPDPLRDDAPGILARLRARPSDALAACLRAHGHLEARWV
jgi:hypothetical protein